jgi:crotonobetainyl-CoA:carnitine CoA-transferase CaiB-like acyl-CoA transferase
MANFNSSNIGEIGLNNFPQFGVLAGVKVLMSGTAIAGPFGAGLMSECGAQVIHFEGPKSPDNTRGTYGYPQNHRNQESVVADIKTPEGREIFFKLLTWADIFIESSKGGTYERLGLPDTLLWEKNPRLAIVHVSGYGQTGDPAYTGRASFDAVGQAFSGYMSFNGPAEYAMKISPYLSDYVCGLTTCWTALACYIHSLRTGKGESCDVAQYEALARIMDTRPIEYFCDGTELPRTGNKDANAALFSFYTCKDGGTIFIGMCGHGVTTRGYPIIGLPAPGTGDPMIPEGFTGWIRNSPIGERLEAAMEKFVSEHTVHEVEQIMLANQIPCQRVYTLKDCAEDPHWKSREVFTEWDDPMMGRVKGLGLINKFKNNPSEIKWGAPLFGTNNTSVLKDLGYTDAQIKELADKGVTAQFDYDYTVSRYRLKELFAHMRDK